MNYLDHYHQKNYARAKDLARGHTFASVFRFVMSRGYEQAAAWDLARWLKGEISLHELRCNSATRPLLFS